MNACLITGAILAVLISGSPGSVEKARFFSNLGNNGRFARFKNLADDALANPIATPSLLAGGQAVGRLDGDFPAFPVEQGQASPDDARVLGNDLQNRTQGIPQVHARVQGLADIEQKR